MSSENTTKTEIENNQLFLKYIMTLEAGAWVFMGKTTNPATGKIEKNYQQAKEIIELMLMLREKTKNNLSEFELKLLNNAITQVQYNFVEETILKKNKNDISKNNYDTDIAKNNEKNDEDINNNLNNNKGDNNV